LLSGRPEKGAVDPGLLSAWRSAEVDLVEVLDVPEEALTALSLQAIAFMEVGKPAKAKAVLIGLGALGRVHLVDVLVMVRALAAEGHEDQAAIGLAHEQRLERGLGLRVPEGPPLVVLRDYLNQLERHSVAEIQAEWEEQRRLAGALTSYLAWLDQLAGQKAPLLRVEAALKVVGPSAALSAFPQKALKAAIKQVGTPRPQASATVAELEPLERLRARLGAPVSEALQAAVDRTPGPRFLRLLKATAQLIDQASTTPSYCVTRMGWHYPRTLAEYRAGHFSPMVAELSEMRWVHSLELAAHGLHQVATASRPEVALEVFLRERFFSECGHDLARAPIPGASIEAIVRALDHQLLTPLRALNETILDFDFSGLGAPDDVRRMVDALMRAIAREDYALFGPFWASKLNDGTGGFDVAGHRLLGDLKKAGAFGASFKQE
jgi:hypothetical protein